MDDDRIELAVVGAGPCGLAILSRLSRDCTSTGTHELGPESAAAILRATVVIDPAGGWLAAWRRKLGSQGVAQLRSPAFVHPHPSRVIDETLRRWADAHGRRAELDAIAAADVADVPRDRPWHTPSAGAFDGFCAGLLAGLLWSEPLTLADVVHRGLESARERVDSARAERAAVA